MKLQIQTDNKIKHNKPNIVVLDKIECTCLIIDVACHFDIQVKDKENEKIENCKDLKRELKRIWKLRKATVVPIIIGALGTVSNDIKKWLTEIGVTYRLESFESPRKVNPNRGRSLHWAYHKWVHTPHYCFSF